MASGEAEPLQYTTTTLRVSIHCEGCKKKVKKVLHSIEGVYKVTVDAAQHKVTVTGNVEAEALLRRLHKAGKQAALWPSPAPAPAPVEAKKAEEAAPAALPVAAGESGAKDAKPKEAEAAAKDKPPENGEGKEKKPPKDKGSDKKAGKGEAAAKPNKDEVNKDAEVITEPKETNKCYPEPAKQDAAEEAGAEESNGGGGKKGKKNKKSKPKDGDEGEAPAPAAPEKKPHQPPVPAPSPGPERPPHAAFPYYAAQPVLSYNVAHPSSSVSYYAPTPVVPMHPMPPPPQVVPYGYPPYPPMVPVPAEFLYGPPGMRSSPPQESYNMFNEDNANSCSVM
ncbi:unnamed protein product [Miscanthus lutarioriparius]|uniref:HMA domain-containing protein n=1 Tax=Miscanthus lutarioriparius TaxID=422564 RepID=A0A811N249_9POAL|nr:unnamed protein product [Miscanthus lutarioriparius]